MAGRVTTTKVPWQQVLSSLKQGHPRQVRLQEMKAKVDSASMRVVQLPAEKATVNFEYYRQRLPASLVDEFEKKYAEEVPYYNNPEIIETQKMLEADKMADMKQKETQIAEMNQAAANINVRVERLSLLPPREEWTRETKYFLFPQQKDYEDWLRHLDLRSMNRRFPSFALEPFERTDEDNAKFATKHF